MDLSMAKKALPTRTVNPLPFQDLEPHRFEDLVRNLIYDFRRWRTIEATGKGGSDDGFDVRAWEVTSELANADEDNEAVGTHPMEGNLWKLQCKREKQLGPTKIKAIVNEGLDKDNPPYGYILAAPATFSKQSYDVFRDELRSKGVMEFYLWGKSELEDMLFLPKNDGILFAFFGISLITRKRLRTSEIKFSINNKNKLLRILGAADSLRTLTKKFLARDFKDVHYPYKNKYNNFNTAPRWKEYTAVEFHRLGLIANVAEHFAFVNCKTKSWDFVPALNLIHQQSEDDDVGERYFDRVKTIRNFWRYLPRANQATLIRRAIIFFEDILVIDEKGDSEYCFPHIFVDFRAQSGPFRGRLDWLEVEKREIFLDEDYKREKIFPDVLPSYSRGTIYKDRTVQLDEATRRRFGSVHFLKNLFDVDGKYGFLNRGDIIRVEGVKPTADDAEALIEITCKYKTDAREYVADHPELREQIEAQTGKKVEDSVELTILEFENAWSWQLKDE
jgi:hypothetical protein